MDIGSGRAYPSDALSNFAPHPFVFDGVEVSSMEGLLQSFKFEKRHIQVEVCRLVGYAAKQRGRPRTKHWQALQTLWWDGVSYDRHGPEYQALLDRAYDALATNSSFRKALIATGDAVLTHSIGRRNPRETILTKTEFCRRLTALRDRFRVESQDD